MAHKPPAAPPKKVTYTAAQNASFHAYLKSHPSTRASRVAARKAGRVQARKNARIAARRRAAPFVTATTLSPGVVTDGSWIVADNDRNASCVSVALANSLLSRTGVRVPDDDVMAFHSRIAGDDGVSIPDALDLARLDGIGGYRLSAWSESLTVCGADILGMTDGFSEHAVTVTPSGLISWGSILTPELADDWWLDGEFYALTWREG